MRLTIQTSGTAATPLNTEEDTRAWRIMQKSV
jgi:hypothetical protein